MAGDEHGVEARPELTASWRSQIRAGWNEYRWPVIALFWLAVLALGFVGYVNYPGEDEEMRALWDAMYRAVQLFGLEFDAGPGEMPWELQAARFLAPAVTILTALETLALLFAEQVDRLRPRLMSDHVVICGLGDRGLRLARGFRGRGHAVVAIESDRDNVNISPARDHGVVVLIADASSRVSLERAGVDRARSIIAVCGGDGPNAEVATHARALACEREVEALTCFMHVIDLELCWLLRAREIATQRPEAFRLEFFNIYETGARAMLDSYPATSQSPSGADRAHILVIGLGRLGESVVVNAARRHRRDRPDARLKITVADPDATDKLEALQARFPALGAQCELMAVDVPLEASQLQRRDLLVEASAGCPLTAAYVCLEDDGFALAAALALHRQCTAAGRKASVVVRTREGTGLAALLATVEEGSPDFANLHAFPLLDETCRPEALMRGVIETIARAMHADYLRRQIAHGEELRSREALHPWEELSEEYRESNRAQADDIARRLEAFGYRIAPLTDPDAESFEFSPDEVEGMAKMEHDRWCEEKRSKDWTYGEPRDDQKRIHPDLVPWEDLSEEAKEKDRRFVRDLPIFLAEVGFQVERVRES